MLVGHFDESGLDSASTSFWVAGYVAHMSEWFEFSRAWNHVLRRFDVPAFHATDCSNAKKDFADWRPEKRAAIMDELVSVINSSNVVGFGAGVVKADYQRLIVNPPGLLEDLQLTRDWWKEPYLLAFQNCIVEAVLKGDAQELNPRERFSFVFEEQAQFAPRSEAVFAEMRNAELWPRADRLGSIRYTPVSDSTPLQAADMLVYELRKRLDHLLEGNKRPVRISLRRLTRRISSARWVGARRLGEIVEEIRRSRTSGP